MRGFLCGEMYSSGHQGFLCISPVPLCTAVHSHMVIYSEGAQSPYFMSAPTCSDLREEHENQKCAECFPDWVTPGVLCACTQ